MTFQELREEFCARGFDDFSQSDARVKRWCNEAYAELCEEEPWPFLRPETQEGTAPLEIKDLAHVLSVTDKTHEMTLAPADERGVVAMDPNLSGTGPASCWYRSGETTIKVWPTDSATYVVRYQRVADDLSEDTDTPLVPSRYHGVIVDGMVVRGLKQRSAWDEVVAARQEWERGVAQMTRALLHENYDGPKLIRRTGTWVDYL